MHSMLCGPEGKKVMEVSTVSSPNMDTHLMLLSYIH